MIRVKQRSGQKESVPPPKDYAGYHLKARVPRLICTQGDITIQRLDHTVCPRSSDPQLLYSKLLYKMGLTFLDIQQFLCNPDMTEYKYTLCSNIESKYQIDVKFKSIREGNPLSILNKNHAYKKRKKNTLVGWGYLKILRVLR